ncbi:TPA: hypothetical protein DIC39_03020 [Patescibacteria group bacterium]|nr:MAG: hypothetical protein A2006_11675 [Ignavibacteria bacterium GWC2_35_8]OGW71165.1 MAG: hypothetical protein A2047_03930 [Omnitrophica bacterium GWA2_41_15]HCU48003.1 hypothetical protein [Patescibacteria group bacterium]
MIKINDKWLIIILVLIVLIFAFWWYEWRPSHYIRACQYWAVDRAKATHASSYDQVNYFFEKCLRENGIYFSKY